MSAGRRRDRRPDPLGDVVGALGLGALGLVVVDHGSRRDEANRSHEDFVAAWPTGGSVRIVEPAHMELAEPSIATAFDACVAAGATTVVIAPYFLGPGRHWDSDIPALAAAAAAAHPAIRYLVSAPLGPHLLLADIVEERAAHCLARTAGTGPACELCVEGGGCRLR
jgi:sirohydrochlorin ferrochelatase